MPSFDVTKQVHHSAERMFDLVADVDDYPKFLPLCESLTVRGRKEMPDGRQVMVADMTVAYKLIRETFTTKVTLDRETLEILVEYLDGPVSELENHWKFVEKGEGACEILFHLTYDFKSRTFAAVMGMVFDRAFRSFASAFEKRADELYGAN